jgi:DNA-binding LacI/PurR family transcriptional regulator
VSSDHPVDASRRPTLKDVAAEAEVSIQTVSNVIHGRFGQMSGSTQARVRDAMLKLDYTLDRRASALRSGVTRTVAFLVLDEHAAFLGDPLTSLIIAGVGDVARDRDYAMLVQGAKPSSDGQQLLTSLRDRRVDGAIVLLSGSHDIRKGLVGRMAELSLPLVLMDEEPTIGDVSTVRAEQRSGARKIAEHLIELGHRRIAFVGPRVPWAVVEQRLAGVRDALDSAGISPDGSLVQLEAEGYDTIARERVAALLELDDPPTAVICSSDLVALGVVKALRQMNLNVPRDIAVAGFDDFSFASEVSPSLTTLSVPGFEMGTRAAELLLALIAEPEAPTQDVVFPTQLLVRESTSPS